MSEFITQQATRSEYIKQCSLLIQEK